MSSKVPPYSLEKAGDHDTTGSWRVNIDGQLAGYVKPIVRGFGRARQWQALVDGVPIGSPMRTRTLAVALILEQWKKDHS